MLLFICITLLPGGFSQIQVHIICCSKAKTPAQAHLAIVKKMVEYRLCKSSAEFWSSVSITANYHCWQMHLKCYEFVFEDLPRLLGFHFCLSVSFLVFRLPSPALSSAFQSQIMSFLFSSSCVFLLLPPTLLQLLTPVFQGWVAFTCQWNRRLLFGCHF